MGHHLRAWRVAALGSAQRKSNARNSFLRLEGIDDKKSFGESAGKIVEGRPGGP